MKRLSLILATLLVGLGVLTPATRAQEVPDMEPRHTSDSHLFHVTLVIASRGEVADESADLPEAVEEALDDVRGFLPYQGYRILDTAMIRSDGHARVKLKGPDGAEYTAQMTFRRDDQEGGEFVVDRFALVRLDRPSEGGEPLGPGVAPRAPESPLSTSFRVRPGQTVVVGSSRMNGGDQALVVLLSAAR